MNQGQVRVFALGGFLVEVNSQPLRFKGRTQRKPLDLLKFLIAFGGVNVSSTRLREVLWPDSDGDRSLVSFNTNLSRLRSLIGKEAILNRNESLSLNREICWVDSIHFREITKNLADSTGQTGSEGDLIALEEAIALYQGDFLSGFSDHSEIFQIRNLLHDLYLEVLDGLCQHHLGEARTDHAIDLYSNAIRLDPHNESLYQNLMRCYLKTGQHADGLNAYRECKESLQTGFGTLPSAETLRLYEFLKAKTPAGQNTGTKKAAEQSPVAKVPGAVPEKQDLVLARFSILPQEPSGLDGDIPRWNDLMATMEIELARMVSTFNGVVNCTEGNEIMVLFKQSSIQWKSMAATVEEIYQAREELTHISRERFPSREERIDIKVAVSTGSVMMVPGVGGAELYNLVGSAQAMNAWLSAAAKPGAVLVSGSVRAQIPPAAGLVFKPVVMGDGVAADERIEAFQVTPRKKTGWNKSMKSPLPFGVEETLTPPDSPSIVVLAFENLTDSDEGKVFGEGLAESIITSLSKISGLFVIARESSFQYGSGYLGAKQIGEEMGVGFVLGGCVRKHGDSLRIVTHLVEVGTGQRIWAERYDTPINKLHEVEEMVTSRIVRELDSKLVTGEMVNFLKSSLKNPEAIELYFRGRFLFSIITRESNREALTLFKRVIELEPDSSMGYVAMSASHWLDAHCNWTENRAASALMAADFALKALERDPDNPFPYSCLGLIHVFNRNYEEARRNGEKGIQLGPSLSDAYGAQLAILHFSGEWEPSIAMARFYTRLSPISPAWVFGLLGDSLYFLKRYDESLEACRKAAAVNPDYPNSWLTMALCYSAKGQREKAIEAGKAFYVSEKQFPSMEAMVRNLPYRESWANERMLEDLERVGLLGEPVVHKKG